MTYENTFEKLVTAACELNLCWKLYCTTCGNSEIRNGLEFIGMGRLPETIDRDSFGNKQLFDNRQGQCFKRDITLACEAVRADLQNLSQLERPTWLGTLGILLYRFNTPPLLFTKGDDNEQDFDRRRACWSMISSSWAGQFLSMLEVSADKTLLKKLQACEKGRSHLTWQDLTPINVALAAVRGEPVF
jgi:hypothetical protein